MSTVAAARRFLDDARAHRVAFDALPKVAVELAKALHELAGEYASAASRAHDAQLARMLEDPNGKAFTVAMADRVFREPTPRAAADTLRELVAEHGAPSYLPPIDRLALTVGAMAGRIAPDIVVGAARAKFLQETAKVILPAEAEALSTHIAARREQGVRLNLNQLGEAILGEEEAESRMRANLELLERDDVNYISVKVSSVYSQVNALAFEGTVDAVCERLRRLYRAAMKQSGKFINLDMEEFRDLAITVEAFERVLMEDEFLTLEAGIVLQAYLPDSALFQQRLCAWAQARVARGGAGIKVRIVKGANLAMERVEAEMHGWAQAPYATKAEVDANYKRMLSYGLLADNIAAVRLGVASHNLFDLAYALLASAHAQAEDRIDIEMLEGMAEASSLAVRALKGSVLLYAPVVTKENFGSAVAYLVRRLDENTSPDNYLRHSFSMRPGSRAWQEQATRFELAAYAAQTPPDATRRTQSRWDAAAPALHAPFDNASDTDWTRPENRQWLAAALATPMPTRADIPGCAENGTLTDLDAVQRSVAVAREAVQRWGAFSVQARRDLLFRAAQSLEEGRGEAIAVMVREANKAAYEADIEVSEAVDFASYYARAFDDLDVGGATHRPLGVVVVAPPWNFPYAIPAGGVLAALMAGNAVILKPAPEVVETAWVLVNRLWQAGIPRDALQFLPAPDTEVGRELVAGEGTDAVILTGAYETAAMFHDWKPSLRLYAETSGKNGIVISSHADTDLAVKDLVRSAFGHAGQKCSAASLAFVHKDIYDSEFFLRQLKDAAQSLCVAPSSDMRAVVTPLVKAPEEFLQRTLTALADGESWLLEPKLIDADKNLWSPGIKTGVQPGSEAHTREWFGPVLGLMRVESFDEAVALQSATPFGLTAGLHSLDPKEIAQWIERVQAGNLYVNRAITGAVVRRQPFGGWKRSAVGPGAKAGGPNYVLRLCKWEHPEGAHGQDYARALRREFAAAHDPSALASETNVFRYVPLRGLLALAWNKHHAAHMRAGAMQTGVPTRVIEGVDNATLEAALAAGDVERIWTAEPLTDAQWRIVHAAGVSVLEAAPIGVGRLDLLAYYKEQAVSVTAHRYGNPGAAWAPAQAPAH